jgi:hypothetical protein
VDLEPGITSTSATTPFREKIDLVHAEWQRFQAAIGLLSMLVVLARLS